MASSALEAIVQQKRLLRSQVRKKLRNMSPSHRAEEDATIQSHIISSNWFRKSERLCAYISCANLREVETTKVLAECLKPCGCKKLFVPRIEDREGHMRMLHIDNIRDLVANSMNILEPTLSDFNGQPRHDVLDAIEPVDLILLPGLAFDQVGHRLGRGGGYYDSFLSNYLINAKEKGWKQPLLVGLAYSIQVQNEAIPVTPTDQPIDALVSAFGSHPITPRAIQEMASSIQ